MSYIKALAVGSITLALSAAASATASADVQLTIENGRVSLIAKDATLRQILAEWAKVGQIKIVNGERVPGAPLTVQFTNLPEQQVLDTLLRGLSGYVAQARGTDEAHLSRFDRIVVMPTVAAPPSATASAAPPAFPQPSFAQPQTTLSSPDDQQEEGPNRAPVFNTFPPPQVMQIPPNGTAGQQIPLNPATGPLMLPPPTTAPPGSQAPTAYPGGVSVPGMIVPAPPQPGVPGQPIAPPKRPGGGL